VDYPNSTKAKKHYLVLSFDRGYHTPRGLDDGMGGKKQSGVRVEVNGRGKSKSIKKKKKGVKSKEVRAGSKRSDSILPIRNIQLLAHITHRYN